MELLSVRIEKPEAINFILEQTHFILEQTHFIKTVEDLHEALVGAVPGITFGLAFWEASGKCLVRWSGTDRAMIELAKSKALAIGAGHSFVIFFGDGFYPLNVLNALKMVPEVWPHDPWRGGRRFAKGCRERRRHRVAKGSSAENRLQTLMAYGLATDLQIASEPARPTELRRLR